VGTVTGPAVITGLISQMVWILLMLAISGYLWNLGSKKFLAAGG
jgi:ABC-type uncharacterized transport system permease subunit